jgi:protein transport protein SEC13
MASVLSSFDSEHQGVVHDAQYDYYGKRIATAGSDGKINIFEVQNEIIKKVAELAKYCLFIIN